jgi:hypothetical protein
MARSTPAAQIAHAETQGYSVHQRVQVKNGSGSWVNLSSLQGIDWVSAVEYGEDGGDIDDPVVSLTVEVFRETEAYSLAPLHETSALNVLDDGTTYSPLLHPSREIKWEACTLGISETPATADWQLFFHGYIDRVRWPGTGSKAYLECRDLGARLVDTFIETATSYASAGTAVQTVVQSILTDNSTSVTVYTPSSPGFNITKYIPHGVSVMEACQRLVNDTTGWVARYKWDSGTSAFRFTIYDPDRTKASPDKTLPPTFWMDPHQLDLGIENIRNRVKVLYTDVSTGQRASVTAQDTTSRDQYGGFFRFMEIEEGDDSPIDTSTEAQRLCDAALADLKDPLATMEVETLFYPWLELQDLVRFSANDIHFTTDQDLAITGIRHRVGPVQEDGALSARSFFKVRGQPAGQYTRWLAKETRPTGADRVPYVESLAIVFDEASDIFKIAGSFNPETASAKLQISDDSAFATSWATATVTVVGSVVYSSATITIAMRNKPWYAKATPYNLTGAAGLPGTAATDSVRVEGNVSKKIRISGVSFVEDLAAANPFTRAGSGLSLAGSGISATAWAAVVLPVGSGVTMTGLSVRGNPGAAGPGDSIVAVLKKQDDGSSTTIATATNSTSGSFTTASAGAFTETTTGNTYYIELTSTLGAAADQSYFNYVEVEYTSPTLDSSV